MDKFYFCKRWFKIFKDNKDLVPVPESSGPKEMKDRICIKCATMSPINLNKETKKIKSRYMNNTHTRNILSLERMAQTSRADNRTKNNALFSETLNFISSIQNDQMKTTPVKTKRVKIKKHIRKTKSSMLTKRNLNALHENEASNKKHQNDSPSNAANMNFNHDKESTFTIPNIDVAYLEHSKDHDYFNHEASEYGKTLVNKEFNSPEKSESAWTDDEFDFIKEDVCFRIYGDKDALSKGGVTWWKIHPDKIIEYIWK